MPENYAVIVENDISAWADETGVLYHFPKRYLELLKPNTRVVYYKEKLKINPSLKVDCLMNPIILGRPFLVSDIKTEIVEKVIGSLQLRSFILSQPQC